MFDDKGFMPHGHSFLWRPDILWLHVISDVLIAIAYLSIPVALIYFVRKRKDLSYKWMFILFGAFISLCGLTHLMSVYTMWVPNYQLEGILKAVTGAVSIAAAVLLWPLIPKALRLPSPKSFAEKNKQLEDLNRHLESRVAKKLKMTAELADALQVRNQQLRDANAAKDEFIATLSHELRNPLNIILGYLDLMANFRPGTPEYGNALDVIKKSAGTQLQLLEDLLDISRITTGKLVMAVKPSNVEDIVDNAVKAVQFAARAKQIRIERQIDAASKTIVCDPSRIQQVLWNLLSNAVKFTGPNGKITIRAGRDNGFFVFQVSDTGCGISENELPLIFDRLWQSANVKGSKLGGLGLGLRITKDLVEAHGGEITAKSEGEGKGTLFEIRLPIRAVSINEEDEESSFSRKSPLHGMNILVVDDSPDAVDMIRIVLEKAGARVTTALDGAQALDMIKSNNIQLIISDINMPIMDGYVFLENARRVEREKGAEKSRPAIALTGRSGPGEKERAYQAGYQLHLIKPVQPTVLVEKVLHVMKQA